MIDNPRCEHCGSKNTRKIQDTEVGCLVCGRYSYDPPGTPMRPVARALSADDAAEHARFERMEVVKPRAEGYADREFRPLVFVFGSNLMGIHGKGAAAYACARLGAIYRREVGRQGCSYALPTLDRIMAKLPIETIKKHADDFMAYAKLHNDEDFFLTRVGCGLAGFTDAEIAPLFKDAPPNVIRPIGW